MKDSENQKTKYQPVPPAKEPKWIAVPKWIRVRFGDKYIADSRHVMLMREMPPVYYFPKEDVKLDYLKRGTKTTKSEDYGTASYWHVEAGGDSVQNAAWCYETPAQDAPAGISNYIAFKWDAMEKWMEEDEVVYAHPRDPYSRIDIRYSSQHVRVDIGGHTLAESHAPVILFETGAPPRYYLKPADVRMDLLKPTSLHTECPYKGRASYYSVMIDGKEFKNFVWYYPFPYPEMAKIRGLLTLFPEKADGFYIDGERLV
ncbi:MAG: DUF427 domain-containing protein [Bacteroidales bacterium]